MSSATTQDLPLVVRLLLEGGKLTEEQLEHVRKARNEGHGTIEEALVLTDLVGADGLVVLVDPRRLRDRAGDILASLHGVLQRPDVDGSKIALAGWSHGGWGIMEAMSADRSRPALGLADPGNVSLDLLIGAYLAYPYVGIAAFNRMRPWRHCPRTLAVIARSDHLTTVRNAERVHAMIRDCGAEVETWIADGSHSFDEPMTAPPMRYDARLSDEALRRFGALLVDVAVAPHP